MMSGSKNSLWSKGLNNKSTGTEALPLNGQQFISHCILGA